MAEKTWYEREWPRGRVFPESHGLGGYFLTAVFLTFWSTAFWPGGPLSGRPWLGWGFLLSLAALVCWVLAGIELWRRLRFGGMTLYLDPFPAALGGEFGAWCRVKLSGGRPFKVTAVLRCEQVTVTNAKKRTAKVTRVLWRVRGPALVYWVRPGEGEIRLRVRLPHEDWASQPGPWRSGRYYRWRLHLHAKLPGVDLDHWYVVPVLALNRPRSSRLKAPYLRDPDLIPPLLTPEGEAGVRED